MMWKDKQGRDTKELKMTDRRQNNNNGNNDEVDKDIQVDVKVDVVLEMEQQFSPDVYLHLNQRERE